MVNTKLYWVDGPWPGRLALTSRPRGGEWLVDEVAAWRRAGVAVVVSLLTPFEARELELVNESREATANKVKFISFPIDDRDVPQSESAVRDLLEKIDIQLSAGSNVLVHCRQGIGRSGLIAACLLITKGKTPDAALRDLSKLRGTAVPETAQQRDWIEHFATTVAASK